MVQKALAAMHYVEQKKSNTYLEYRIGKMYQYGLGTDEKLEQAGSGFPRRQQRNISMRSIPLACSICRGKEWSRMRKPHIVCCSVLTAREIPMRRMNLENCMRQDAEQRKNQEKSENCYRVAFLGFLNLEKRSKDDTLWYRIGCMYLHGIGTEADETKAEHYLTKASDYGNTHASYQLARLYIRQESQKLSGGVWDSTGLRKDCKSGKVAGRISRTGKSVCGLCNRTVVQGRHTGSRGHGKSSVPPETCRRCQKQLCTV